MKRRGFLKFLAVVPVALAVPPPEKRKKKLTQKDKESLIEEMLRTSEGRKKLAMQKDSTSEILLSKPRL